jgi:hypothetical protein
LHDAGVAPVVVGAQHVEQLRLRLLVVFAAGVDEVDDPIVDGKIKCR